jgi:ubiquinone/menaquinone biosynthesis C-methylase UbiE
MANPGSSTGEFKPALRFDRLTALFDPVVALTTRERAFKRLVLERARIEAGERLLDLGCGTGTLALMAHAQQPAAAIAGLDADPAILAQARAKTAAAGAPIDFHEGFSTRLPFAGERFDAIVSTLFFHHLSDADKRATAAEALRVLAPDGRLVVADLGRPQDPAMRLAVAATVQLLDGRPTTSLNVAGGLPRVFADAGFTAVTVTDRLRTPVGTIELVSARRPAG